MGGRQRFEIPDGWVARGYRFEVQPTSPEQLSRIRQHFGARRFAHNWALAAVKANLDARTSDPTIQPLAWTLPTLRKAWNQAKHEAAPWWATCSKEAYASGIADLVTALKNWADTKHGRVEHPAPWAATQKERRRVARQLSRRTVGSRGYCQTIAKLAALDRRLANLRRESIHLLTTTLTRRYGTIVIEDLDVAAMARGMGRRAFRRTVQQAGIGAVRPTLGYKTECGGGRLVVADRWFASSKTHHGCGGYLADLKLSDRAWDCPRCGVRVDRNANAALNLRDWSGPVAA